MDNKNEEAHGALKEEKAVSKISPSSPIQYVVDWSKVNNILDLIDLLKGMNFSFYSYEDDKDLFKDLLEKGLIVKSVKDLAKQFNQEIKEDNTIDLGWENGWGKNKTDFHRELFNRQEPGSYSRIGEAAWQKFSFSIIENGVEYKVVYKLDSGD